MKKRVIKITLLSLGVLAGILIIASVTRMLQWFSASTTACYPAIKPGDWVFTSNLVKPDRFSIISYYATTPEFGKEVWAHRLCGLEGDKIEIKNGDLYVNNKFADNEFPVSHVYIFPFHESEKISEVMTLDDMHTRYVSADSMTSYLPVKTVEKLALKARRIIVPADEKNEYIYQQFGSAWNQDHFGPVIVPKGKYFVLGDNRSYSQDSRYMGFIDKSDYVATVLGR
ncbi:signal peptidase I [Terrimonas rubra]|uniref:Signal peptidase I n=1 Tax=Terrimonas rubra TaxID=1035890 RepID=A0ABW6A6P1_9BACT